MPNWLTKLLGGRPDIPKEARGQVYGQSVRDSAFDQNESEEAYRKNLAVFLESVSDEGVERILAEKMIQTVRVPATDAEGNILFVTNPDGSFVLDASGNKVELMMTYTKINDFYAAIYNFQSKVNRLSHINPSDAKIHYWYFEQIVDDIIMSCPRSKLNSGEIAYLKSWLNYVHILLQDATGGKKLNALLTVKKEASHNVGVGPIAENKMRVN